MTDRVRDESLVHPDQCEHCPARDIGLFADVTGDDRDRLLARLRHLRGPAGTALYREGDTGHDVFIVRLGLVKLVKRVSDGSDRIVRLARPGDVLGLGLIVGQKHGRTARAMTTFDACRVPVDLITHDVHRIRGLERKLFQQWEASVDAADEILAELSTGTAHIRVARLFLQLLHGAHHPVCPSISREEMGELLSITTETASRVVADFKRQGVLSETGLVFRCDIDKLRNLAQGKEGP